MSEKKPDRDYLEITPRLGVRIPEGCEFRDETGRWWPEPGTVFGAQEVAEHAAGMKYRIPCAMSLLEFCELFWPKNMVYSQLHGFQTVVDFAHRPSLHNKTTNHIMPMAWPFVYPDMEMQQYSYTTAVKDGQEVPAGYEYRYRVDFGSTRFSPWIPVKCEIFDKVWELSCKSNLMEFRFPYALSPQQWMKVVPVYRDPIPQGAQVRTDSGSGNWVNVVDNAGRWSQKAEQMAKSGAWEYRIPYAPGTTAYENAKTASPEPTYKPLIPALGKHIPVGTQVANLRQRVMNWKPLSDSLQNFTVADMQLHREGWVIFRTPVVAQRAPKAKKQPPAWIRVFPVVHADVPEGCEVRFQNKGTFHPYNAPRFNPYNAPRFNKSDVADHRTEWRIPGKCLKEFGTKDDLIFLPHAPAENQKVPEGCEWKGLPPYGSGKIRPEIKSQFHHHDEMGSRLGQIVWRVPVKWKRCTDDGWD